MADIAVGDVTHLVLKKRNVNSKKRNLVRLSFGDGSLTYPSGGIPLSKANMGCPNVIESLIIVDQGVIGYQWKYDQSTGKLVGWYAPASSHAHDFLVKGGTAEAGTDALNIKTVIIGKEAATDATSLAADTATKGGVLAATLAAGVLTELSAVAIAAQVLEVEVTGW